MTNASKLRDWFRTVCGAQGQALAEYGLVLALVALVVVGAVLVFGQATFDLYNGRIGILVDAVRAVLG